MKGRFKLKQNKDSLVLPDSLPKTGASDGDVANIATGMGYKSASAAKKQKYKCMERVRKLALLEMKKVQASQKNDSFERQTG